MKLLVTRIFFDLPDEDANQFGSIIGAKEYKQQLQFDLQTTAKSIWEVDSYSALKPKIERTLGHKISTIEYTANLLHPLTSYL
tara:strand:+ start:122 stop:370 length:249 start_codon:yes stop_codon:yes gene_type:complete